MQKYFPEKHVFFQSLLISSILIMLTVPCFKMTGNLILPVVISFLGSVAVCLVVSVFRNAESSIGFSLIICNLFWFVAAIVGEVRTQIDHGFVFEWIQYFYFDKLLIVGTVWLACSLFFALKRVLSKHKQLSDFDLFFKYSSFAFICFYSFVLVYSFVLIRLQSDVYPFRFQPFVTIREYIDSYAEVPYEIIMNVLGNLFYFTPLGYIFMFLLSNKNIKIKVAINAVFPVIAFTLLEFSQYIFQNGYCEFDDMMMNSIGFWVGNLLCLSSDKLAEYLSKGRIKRFWS